MIAHLHALPKTRRADEGWGLTLTLKRMVNSMKLEEIATFVAVVQEGGLQAAAERLARTQPAISQSLKRLEDGLGLSLFDRSGYRLALTPNGRLLFEKAVVLLKGADDFRSFTKLLASGREPSFRVALHGSLDVHRIMDVLRELESVLDGAVMTLSEGSVFRPIAQVISGQADIGVMPWDSKKHSHVDFDSIPIGMVRYDSLISTRLLRQRPIQAALKNWLKQVPQILLLDTSPPPSQENVLIEGGVFHLVTSHQLKKTLIAEGLGWGRLDAAIDIAPDGVGNSITTLDVVPSLDVEIRVIRLPNRSYGPVMEQIWTAFRKIGHSSCLPQSRT